MLAAASPPGKTPSTAVVTPPPLSAAPCVASALSIKAAGAGAGKRAVEVDNHGPVCSLPTQPGIVVHYAAGTTRALQATPKGTAAQQSSVVVPHEQGVMYVVAEPVCAAFSGGPPPEGSVTGFSFTYQNHDFSVMRDYGFYIECPLQFMVFVGAMTL